MDTSLIDKIDNFVQKQEKVYLQPGEKPPKGTQVMRGPKGGMFYQPSKDALRSHAVYNKIVEEYNKQIKTQSHNDSIKNVSKKLNVPIEEVKQALPEKPKKGYMYPEWDKIYGGRPQS